MNVTTDDALLDQLKQGEAAAYELLVAHYEGPLYRFFYCDHGNHHTAQEQLAETFAQLVRSLPNMHGGPEKLNAFVFAVARNVQRRSWRSRTVPSLPIEHAGQTCDPDQSPLTKLADREQVERILQCLRELELPLRSVLLLRFVEDHSLQEIAAALKLPLGTVKSHIHRGREKLRQVFTEEDCCR